MAVLVCGLTLPVSNSFAAPSDNPVGQTGLREIQGRFFVDNKIASIADGVPAKAVIDAVLPRVNAHLAEIGFSLSSASVEVSLLPTPDLSATLREMSQLPTGAPDVFNIAIAGATGNGKFGLAIPAVACQDGVNSAIVAVYRGLSDQALETLAITIAHELTHVLGYSVHSTDRQNGVANIMFPYSITQTFGYSDETKQVVASYLDSVKICMDTFGVGVAQLGTAAILSDDSPFEVYQRSNKKLKYRFFVREGDNSGYPSVSCHSNKVGKTSITIKKRKLRTSKRGPKNKVVEVRLAARHRKSDSKSGVISCEITSASGIRSTKTLVF